MNKKFLLTTLLVLTVPFAAVSPALASGKSAPTLEFSTTNINLKTGETAKVNLLVKGTDISNNAEIVLVSTGVEISNIETNENCLSLNQTMSTDGATLDIAKVTGDFTQNEAISTITITGNKSGSYTIKFSPDARVNQKEVTAVNQLTVTVSDSGTASSLIDISSDTNVIPLIGIGLGIVIIIVLGVLALVILRRKR